MSLSWPEAVRVEHLYRQDRRVRVSRRRRCRRRCLRPRPRSTRPTCRDRSGRCGSPPNADQPSPTFRSPPADETPVSSTASFAEPLGFAVSWTWSQPIFGERPLRRVARIGRLAARLARLVELGAIDLRVGLVRVRAPRRRRTPGPDDVQPQRRDRARSRCRRRGRWPRPAPPWRDRRRA